MTKKAPAVNWPFIYMNNVARNADGTIPAGTRIPLIAYGTGDAAEVTWTFNGKEIDASGTGYIKVTENGTLKVHIIWKDGREEVIHKEIRTTKKQ